MSRSSPVVRAYLLACVPLCWLIARFSFVCDDAYIAFRFSRNLARGLGLRYNPGVEPPVEGYTQLGWVLAMAPVEWLGGDPAFWSRAVSIACAFVLLALVLRFAARRLELDEPSLVLAGLFLGLLPGFAVWATGGLGTMAFALAIFVTFERLLGDPERSHGLQAGLAGACVALLRADGPYFLGVIFLLALARWGARSRAAWTYAGLVAGALVLLTLFRVGYHGHLVPHTARVKVGVSALTVARGLRYVGTWCVLFPAAVLALCAGIPAAVRERSFPLCACLVMSAATFFYAVASGGDFMAMGRFLVPATPFLALLFAASARSFVAAPAPRLAFGAALAATSLLPAFNLHLLPRSTLARLDFRPGHATGFQTEYERWVEMDDNARNWSEVGRALARAVPADSSLVIGAIGAIGYHSDLFVHDRRGLVTPEVLALENRKGTGTPGHDYFAPVEFFAAHDPTYAGAYVTKPRPGAEPYSPLGAVEVIALDPADGFEPGSALFVIRPRKEATR